MQGESQLNRVGEYFSATHIGQITLYILMNSPFLSAEGWKAEVAKMRGPLAAPIEQSVADEIVAYLSATYAAPPKP